MSSQPKAVPPAVNAWSADYLDAQHQAYLADPASVPPDLRAFFQGFDLGRTAQPLDGQPPAPAGATGAPRSAPGEKLVMFQPLGLAGAGQAEGSRRAAVAALMYHYRDLGHLAAAIDPFDRERAFPVELDPQTHGLREEDLDEVFDPGPLPMGGPATLRDIIGALDETYCGHIGVEFMHIPSSEERVWLASRMETSRNKPTLTNLDREHILHRVLRSDSFEKFLHTRYPGEKRFSLEGAESLIPLLDRVVEAASASGVVEIVMGMAHRGRLNVLNNILGKSHEQIFTEFEDTWEEDFADGGGDVKYHRGYSGEFTTRDGKRVWLAMASNPSHLESVGPVVAGRCRAKQRVRGDADRSAVIPLLIHGDAAVIAQGVVAETLNLSQLPGYTNGGTIHVVINNLIGFTTGPEDARSTTYCTDLAKFIDAPIFHVNGEDPEACVHAAQLAVEYRQRFRKDVFIDLWCYRRWGHNESDEPSFTQPILYSLIRAKDPVLNSYAERLHSEGVIGREDFHVIRDALQEAFERAQQASRNTPFDPTIDPGSRKWQGFGKAYSHAPVQTGVTQERLREIAAALGRVPEGFNLNRKLKRLLDDRAASCDDLDAPIDYATAESLAFGALLVEGVPVRLTGQDSRRGTFSHRHAVLRDAETGEPFIPLNSIREVGDPETDHPAGEPGSDGRPRQARFCVYDSPLSEAAIVGFEYGYSLVDPNQLVLWEAQFGDFANGAQVMFDQYLAAAELKWQRWSGLVLLLPHGYEGAGPEHSSARMERFLQLCADDNMQVVYPSTASQIFHVLRRQVRRPIRKPLILMTPKSMLRVPTSTVRDLVDGRFEEIIDDPAFSGEDAARRKVKRVILCCGKLYHELSRRRDDIGRRDLAIVRIEQVYPLHTARLREILESYPSSAELVWAQEEPRNVGAYAFMDQALREELKRPLDAYIGRARSATPAVGSITKHRQQQERILTDAVGAAPEQTGDAAARKPAAARAR